jgi:DNA-binding NarL/FixJ family response regulator
MAHQRVTKRKDGTLVIELDAVLRIPIEFEAIRMPLVTDIFLTARERPVLDGILRGMQNKEIAAMLHLSESAIKHHVSSLLKKFLCRSRHDLAVRFAGQKVE